LNQPVWSISKPPVGQTELLVCDNIKGDHLSLL
jgi:hypothetical protein